MTSAPALTPLLASHGLDTAARAAEPTCLRPPDLAPPPVLAPSARLAQTPVRAQTPDLTQAAGPGSPPERTTPHDPDVTPGAGAAVGRLRLVSTGMPPAELRPRLKAASSTMATSAAVAAGSPEQGDEVRLTGSLATVVLEVLQGRRPVRQLAQCVDPEAASVVQSWSSTTCWTGARLVSARASRVGRASVEGCVRVDLGGRSLMLILRLEASGGRWRCVRLELLTTPAHLAALGLRAA